MAGVHRWTGAAAVALFACSPPGSEDHEHSLMHTIEAAEAAYPAAESVPAVATVPSVTAQGFAERPWFAVGLRSPDLEKYPCSECHTEPVARMRATRTEQRDAHWGIMLEHAGDMVMRCATCHALDDMDRLTTLTGEDVGMDHSYLVCAQCHSAVARDWSGGAHGKRMVGWGLPRAVEGCPSCHDPHRPAWDTRLPATPERWSE